MVLMMSNDVKKMSKMSKNGAYGVKVVKKWCLWCQMMSNDDKKEPFFDIFDIKMVSNSVKDVKNGAYGVK